MKDSTSYLPLSKQLELQKLTKVILENCSDVEKIILFGSYARGDYKEAKDLKPDRKSGHVSDYDILVITSQRHTALDSMLWKKISDECRKLNLTAHTKIITHDVEALNTKLAEAQYFYKDVKKEGVFLFDAKKFELATERSLTEEEKNKIAKKHFTEWFESASQFFENYKFNLGKNWYKKSAFNLRQAAESSYKTLHLVFTLYNPNEHFLEFLSNEIMGEIEKFDPSYRAALQALFSQDTKEDEERFKLLEYAYIGGRYDPDYRISKEDLEILAQDVIKLLRMTKEICEKKIGEKTDCTNLSYEENLLTDNL